MRTPETAIDRQTRSRERSSNRKEHEMDERPETTARGRKRVVHVRYKLNNYFTQIRPKGLQGVVPWEQDKICQAKETENSL